MVTTGLKQRLTSKVAGVLAASDRRLVLTGAGGWLGLATLELLQAALGDSFAERVFCYGSSQRSLLLRDGTTIPQHELSGIASLDHRPTMLLHLAFLTKDRAEQMDEATYRSANRAVSDLVLGALDDIGVTALFVASSGAARYAADDSVAAAMRLYGELKKTDEDVFAAWARARGKTAVITRIFNIAGPYINKHDKYALAAFILDALGRRPIVVRAPHRVMRSSVGIRELMSLVFAIMLAEGGDITSFDTAGTALELEDVASQVAAVLGGGPVERAPISSDRVDDYVGDGDAYNRLLDEYGIERVPFGQQIRDTADFLVAAQ
jgi:nucleoside-diphosphate-sugar epimerase